MAEAIGCARGRVRAAATDIDRSGLGDVIPMPDDPSGDPRVEAMADRLQSRKPDRYADRERALAACADPVWFATGRPDSRAASVATTHST